MSRVAERETSFLCSKKFLVAWAVFLIVVYATTCGWMSWNYWAAKREAVIRHMARIDPKAVEPGKTEPEMTPPEGHEKDVPSIVETGMYIDRIVEFSIVDSVWQADFYMWFKWNDPQLNPGETFQVIDGDIVSRTKIEQKTASNNSQYALYRVSARFTKFFDISRFPMDDHLLTIPIEDSLRQSFQLRYVADSKSTSVSSRVKMPGYMIYNSGIVVKPHSYKTSRGNPDLPADYKATYSQLIYGMWISRPDYGYFFKLLLGLFAAVAIALTSLFIKPTDVDPRFGLAVGGFFGGVANAYIAASYQPNAGTFSLCDVMNGVGLLTIFLVVVQSTISLYLYDRLEDKEASARFDKISIALFLICYPVVNIVIPRVAKL